MNERHTEQQQIQNLKGTAHETKKQAIGHAIDVARPRGVSLVSAHGLDPRLTEDDWVARKLVIKNDKGNM